jgi:hypothetical protein
MVCFNKKGSRKYCSSGEAEAINPDIIQHLFDETVLRGFSQPFVHFGNRGGLGIGALFPDRDLIWSCTSTVRLVVPAGYHKRDDRRHENEERANAPK